MHILILLVMAIVVVYFITLMKKRDTFRFGGDYSHRPAFHGMRRPYGGYRGNIHRGYNYPNNMPIYDSLRYRYPVLYGYNVDLEKCLGLQEDICKEKPNSNACLNKSYCYDYF